MPVGRTWGSWSLTETPPSPASPAPPHGLLDFVHEKLLVAPRLVPAAIDELLFLEPGHQPARRDRGGHPRAAPRERREARAGLGPGVGRGAHVELVIGGHDYETAFLRHDPAEATRDPQRWLQATDAGCYLPDDILVKVDRAAMAASLETRAPFLDTELATFALGLPVSQQYRDGKPKWLSRQLLYRYLPRETVERPKHGFEVPLRQWLRGPLLEWSETLLDPARLRRDGYFDADRIQAVWQKHRNGTHDASQQLWCVLVFQAWLDSFLGSR